MTSFTKYVLNNFRMNRFFKVYYFVLVLFLSIFFILSGVSSKEIMSYELIAGVILLFFPLLPIYRGYINFKSHNSLISKIKANGSKNGCIIREISAIVKRVPIELRLIATTRMVEIVPLPRVVKFTICSSETTLLVLGKIVELGLFETHIPPIALILKEGSIPNVHCNKIKMITNARVFRNNTDLNILFPEKKYYGISELVLVDFYQ